MAAVDVWEALTWECPDCGAEHVGEAWLVRGDKLQCTSCGRAHTVGEHYMRPRPTIHPRPTKSTTKVKR